MRKEGTLFCTLFIVMVLPAFSLAQIALGLSDEDRAEFARHRAALLERMGDETAVFFGAYAREDYQRFRQGNRFYYLTGVEIPFSALILDGRHNRALLFLPPERDAFMTKYEGPSIAPGPEAVAEFGIEDVRSSLELADVLKDYVRPGGTVWTVLQAEENTAGAFTGVEYAAYLSKPFGWTKRQTREGAIVEWLKSLIADVEVKDISPIIDDLRRVKTPWEIARISEACRIAGEGHAAAWKATRPGAEEYQIEAAATEAFLHGGALVIGYHAIVGSGTNNNILHYTLSVKTVEDGELVLMDFGPDYRYYKSDITRTWPAGGKFSEEQRRAYLQCLEIQRRLIEAVKPGTTFEQLNDLNEKLMKDLGYEAYYVRGCGHYLGMAPHDAGDYNKPLEPGVVLTIEPGIYFWDKGWGIRIEDDVLVTGDGHMVLSDMIPKHPDEIEAVMAGQAEQ